jgi:hypothetical protein
MHTLAVAQMRIIMRRIEVQSGTKSGTTYNAICEQGTASPTDYRVAFEDF